MAHTDACKIQVSEFVKKCTKSGLSLNKACKEAQRESDGIPAGTIKRWWYEIHPEKRFKNEPPKKVQKNNNWITLSRKLKNVEKFLYDLEYDPADLTDEVKREIECTVNSLRVFLETMADEVTNGKC